VSQNKMKNTKFRVETFVVTENPNISCDFWWSISPWAKCKYCNSIQRYIKGKVCPAFNLNRKEDVQ
jgi:ssDNA-binding Zn-finger/Zn-ribbon topoisomerase 1